MEWLKITKNFSTDGHRLTQTKKIIDQCLCGFSTIIFPSLSVFCASVDKLCIFLLLRILGLRFSGVYLEYPDCEFVAIVFAEFFTNNGSAGTQLKSAAALATVIWQERAFHSRKSQRQKAWNSVMLFCQKLREGREQEIYEVSFKFYFCSCIMSERRRSIRRFSFRASPL